MLNLRSDELWELLSDPQARGRELEKGASGKRGIIIIIIISEVDS